MPIPIKVTVGDLTLRAELSDSQTALQVAELLPLEARANTWGQELYFAIPIDADLEDDARDAVELGALAYWPPGNALCIFYGRTPVSTSTEIRPASPVSVIGRLVDDCSALAGTASGVQVRIERE